MPDILPLFDNGEIFDHFALQCTPFDEGDVVPNVQLRTPLSLSNGWDGLSPRMIKICDSSIAKPNSNNI